MHMRAHFRRIGGGTIHAAGQVQRLAKFSTYHYNLILQTREKAYVCMPKLLFSKVIESQ